MKPQEATSAKIVKDILEGRSIYFRQLRVPQQEEQNKIRYVTFEEMKSQRKFADFPIKEDSVAATIVELYFFCMAWMKSATKEVMPRCQFVFGRRTVQKPYPKAISIKTLLWTSQKFSPPHLREDDDALQLTGGQKQKQDEQTAISWTFRAMRRLQISVKDCTNSKDEQSMSKFVSAFFEQLEGVARTDSGKVQLTIRNLEKFKNHMERTDLFRRKSKIVEFATYSPLGLTLDDVNMTNQTRAIEQKQNQKKERLHYFQLLIRIYIEQKYLSTVRDTRQQPPKELTNASLSSLHQVLQKKLRNAKNSLAKPIDWRVVKEIRDNVAQQYLKHPFNIMMFLDQNISTFLKQALSFSIEDVKTVGDEFWLFRKKATTPIPTTGGLYKPPVLQFILGYSRLKGIVEVVLISDLQIRQENREFIDRKVMKLKELCPQLDLAMEDRLLDKEKKNVGRFVSIRLYDRHPSEPQQEKPDCCPPSVTLRLLQLMDQTVILLACIREQLTTQTVDDLYQSIDRKLPYEVQHYLNLVRRLGEVHYLECEQSTQLILKQ